MGAAAPCAPSPAAGRRRRRRKGPPPHDARERRTRPGHARPRASRMLPSRWCPRRPPGDTDASLRCPTRFRGARYASHRRRARPGAFERRGRTSAARRPRARPLQRPGPQRRGVGSRARSRIEAGVHKTPDCLVPALLARACDEPRRKDDPVHEHWSQESLDVSGYDVPSPLEECPRASCTLQRKAAPH